jgi:hypothetical protein
MPVSDKRSSSAQHHDVVDTASCVESTAVNVDSSKAAQLSFQKNSIAIGSVVLFASDIDAYY